MTIGCELKTWSVVFEVKHLADANRCRCPVSTSTHSCSGDGDQIWVFECDALICVVWVGVHDGAQLIQFNVSHLISGDAEAFCTACGAPADASVWILEQQQMFASALLHKATINSCLCDADFEGHSANTSAVDPVSG